jgi:hypothetical protein
MSLDVCIMHVYSCIGIYMHVYCLYLKQFLYLDPHQSPIHMYMYVYVFACIIYICIYMHVCVYMCMYVYVCVCIPIGCYNIWLYFHEATVAQWEIQTHMTRKTSVQTPTSSKAFYSSINLRWF